MPADDPDRRVDAGGVSGRHVILAMFAAAGVIALITLALYFATRQV